MIVDQSTEAPDTDAFEAPAGQRKAYRRPKLVKLGSVGDLTLNVNAARGVPDGTRNRRTGRGGKFYSPNRIP